MSAFLAVFHRTGTPVEPALLEQMLAQQPAHAIDGQDTWVEANLGLGHQHFWLMPEEQGERQPLDIAELGLVIAADSRIDNRDELARGLGLDPELAHTQSDAQLIAQAYARWDTTCVEHLLGDFAFVIWDRKQQQVFAARDALGTRGLSYFVTRNAFIAATEISPILAHPAVQPRINEVRVAQFLNFKFDEEEQTFYQDIFHLPPAHCLLVTATSIRRWRYWDFDPERRIRYACDADYAEHYYELLERLVRDRLRGMGTVGISLSGGLDSSTLAAVLANVAGPERKPLRSFSYVFDELTDCDERHYIRQTVAHHGYDATYLVSDDRWTFRDFEQWPVLRDYVSSDAYALLPQAVSQAAEEAGVRLLFSGLYGDMPFVGSRFWLHAMLGDGRFADIARVWRCAPQSFTWRRLLVDDGLIRYTPAWIKETVKRVSGRTTPRPHPALHPDLMRRTASGNTTAPRLDSRPAAAIRRSLFIPSCAPSSAAGRHRHVNRGMELVTPYWDRRLAEFIAALPADQLGLPTLDRRIVRNAIRPHLPPAVAQRPPRTSFLPLMKRGLLERESAAVQHLLHAPRIVEDGYVRREWLEQAYAELPAWNEGNVTAFWCCLCLELWLRRYW